MRYLPRLSLSVWALLALLTGGSVVCLSPAWSADQKPLVINPTTGRTEQMQTGNNLLIPGTSTLTVSSLTSGRVPFVSTGGLVTDSANFRMDITNGTLVVQNASTSGAIGALRSADDFYVDYDFSNAGGILNFRSQSAGVTTGTLNAAGVFTLPAATGNTLVVSSTNDSTSKDTGSIVTEGGFAAEKTIVAGTGLSTTGAITYNAASRVTIDQQTATTSRIIAWGSDASTNGTGQLRSIRSDASSNTLAFSWSATEVVTSLPLNAADNITTTVAGKGLSIKEGSNAKMGAATLVGGTVTVNTTAVTANSRIYLTSQVDGGTPGYLRVSGRVAATSFTITSGSGTDTSTVAWMIVEPAP